LRRSLVCTRLSVRDQAALTGESLPVAVPREDSIGEPGSGKKLWSGSIVKSGEAMAFVTETGLDTMIGEAAKSIQESGGRHVGVFEAKIIMAGTKMKRPAHHSPTPPHAAAPRGARPEGANAALWLPARMKATTRRS